MFLFLFLMHVIWYRVYRYTYTYIYKTNGLRVFDFRCDLWIVAEHMLFISINKSCLSNFKVMRNGLA